MEKANKGNCLRRGRIYGGKKYKKNHELCPEIYVRRCLNTKTKRSCVLLLFSAQLTGGVREPFYDLHCQNFSPQVMLKLSGRPSLSKRDLGTRFPLRSPTNYLFAHTTKKARMNSLKKKTGIHLTSFLQHKLNIIHSQCR